MSCINDLQNKEQPAILLSQEPRKICKPLKNFALGHQQLLIEMLITSSCHSPCIFENKLRPCPLLLAALTSVLPFFPLFSLRFSLPCPFS